MANVTKGITFGATEQVTNTKLHDLVDGAQVDSIVQADMNANNGVLITGSTAPTDTDALWRDSANANVIKYYNGSAWVVVGYSPSDADAADFDDVNENFLDGCILARDSDTVLSVTSGSAMINGKLRRNATSTTSTPSLTASKWNDVYLVADASASTWTIEVITNQATPGASTATGTNTRFIGSIYSDSANDLTGARLVRAMQDKVVVYGYIVGDGTSDIEESVVTHGVTFSVASAPSSTFTGELGGSALPGEVSDLVTRQQASTISTTEHTTTSSVMRMAAESGAVFASTIRFGYKLVYEGKYT